MGINLARLEHSVVVAIDPQPNFLKSITDSEQLMLRGLFLLEVSALLEVPILITEQNPLKMGGVDPKISEAIGEDYSLYGKMSFSCCGSEPFIEQLQKLNKKQIFLWGIETHICVCQSAIQLMQKGFEVFVATDAVGARSGSAHHIGLSRIKQSGAILTHTESIAYEWIKNAENPSFREILDFVKKYTELEQSLPYSVVTQDTGPLGMYWSTPPL